ncbi:unnamed protein product [Lactuca saligna]|uniref:Transposase (putative) gypsy type domain-containing protein n=1 Tax=Lactuca saligna TaxID=75948 RepID=A0AA35ZYE0_LACSI|nr:unnamed protein product [Lactuca saligna]
MAKNNLRIHNAFSVLTKNQLNELVKSFHIDPRFCPQLHSLNQTITNPRLGCVGVYSIFFKSGLQLLSIPLFGIILDYYKVHIAQITTTDFLKIMCFMLLCRALDIPPSLSFFRYLYVPIFTKDWVYFSLRCGGISICNGLPSFITKWKEEFFFVYASAIAGHPGESIIGLANLGSNYGSSVATTVPTLRGDNLTLLERLRWKHRSKTVKRGSSSATKSDSPYDVDVMGESGERWDSTIHDSLLISTGTALLSSENLHGKPPPVPTYPSLERASSATFTKPPKRKVRPSYSSSIGVVLPGSSPNKMRTSRSSPDQGQGVVDLVLGLPPSNFLYLVKLLKTTQ